MSMETGSEGGNDNPAVDFDEKAREVTERYIAMGVDAARAHLGLQPHPDESFEGPSAAEQLAAFDLHVARIESPAGALSPRIDMDAIQAQQPIEEVPAFQGDSFDMAAKQIVERLRHEHGHGMSLPMLQHGNSELEPLPSPQSPDLPTQAELKGAIDRATGTSGYSADTRANVDEFADGFAREGLIESLWELPPEARAGLAQLYSAEIARLLDEHTDTPPAQGGTEPPAGA